MAHRNLVISHVADIDGMGGAILGKLFDPTIDIILVDVHELEKTVTDLMRNMGYQQYENIFIVDLPIRGTLINAINNNLDFSSRVVHFDHHSSDYSSAQYSWSTVIHERNGHKPCGTTLFHEYLVAKYPDNELLKHEYTLDLIETIRSYDTWDWAKTKNLKARDLTYLFIQMSIEMGPEMGIDKFIEKYFLKIWEMYHQGIKSAKFNFSEEEQKLIDALIEDIKNHIEACDEKIIRETIDGYNVGILATRKYRSDVGNVLSERHKEELDFIIMLDFERDRVSLRTVNDIDLGMWAKQYGGGGIPKSAGMDIPQARAFMSEELIERLRKMDLEETQKQKPLVMELTK